MPSLSRKVNFRGTVQGVGFRFTVVQVCQQSGVAGWVQNLPDGSVDAELVGEQAVVGEALRRIKEVRRDYIESVSETEQPESPGTPDSFEIRY